MAVTNSNESSIGSSQPLTRKVKSGCHTCKRRKVKCDERWPVCNRCQSTGRTCDGYGVWGGGSQDKQARGRPDFGTHDRGARTLSSRLVRAQLNPAKLIPLVRLGKDEDECLDWFMSRSAVKLPGAFVSYHWTTTLFQASVQEPAVRHAMLALGSAHKEEVQGLSSTGQVPNNELAFFTTSQYSKSIRQLQPHFGNASVESLRVTLIACALFVWMEFLRGQYANAFLHLEHGLSLLREIADGSPLRVQDLQSLCVDGWIITLTTRNLVQAKLFSQMCHVRSGEYLNLDPGLQAATTFRNIHHARRSLEHLMLQAMDVQEQSYQQVAAGPNHCFSNQLIFDQRQMKADLQTWLCVYEMTLNNLSPDSYTVIERFAFGLLRLYYHLAFVMVGTCLETSDETRFDHYESNFATIIAHCTEIYKIILPTIKLHPRATFHHDPEASSPQSTSDIGWIPPLYYTAIKCRNHHLRHQAVRFLQWHPHKEGVWNSVLAVLVAKKVIEIEEEGHYLHLDFTGDAEQDLENMFWAGNVVSGSTLPTKQMLNRVEVSLPDDQAPTLSLRYCRLNADGIRKWSASECDVPKHQWIDRKWTTSAASAPARFDST